MRSGPPRAIGALLVSALPQLEDRLLVQRMRRTWSALVGADVARRAEPQALVNGCLTIVVDNSPWLHELTLRAAELTERLQAACPAVRSLRFTLGRHAEAEETPAPARPAPRRPALTEDERRAIDAAAGAISDPAVAAGARRLLARAWPTAAVRGKER